MRVLIATDHFPPFIGGGHRWAALLASGLAGRGHEVTVATMWHGGLARLERHGPHEVPVHRLRQLRTVLPGLVRDRGQRHSTPFPDPVTVWDLRHVVAAAAPEVVLSHGWLSFSVAAALAGGRRIPLIASAHDYGYFCATRVLVHRGAPCDGPGPLKCLRCAGGFYGRPKGWTARLGVAASRRLLARRLDALHATSSFVGELTARYLLSGPGDRRTVPCFAINPFLAQEPAGGGGGPERERVAAVLARLPSEPFIAFVGALRPIKGVEVLFEAYRRLADPPPLVLMGTIEPDTPRRLPEHATVLTDVPHAAVMEALERAMIAVFPSLWPEPFGIVAMEAASRGTATIATAPSGTVDVLGNGAGILVPQGDSRALADALSGLIGDPARRAELGRRAKARAAALTAERLLPRYEAMLEQVVAAGASRGRARRRGRGARR
jgi:glycosyltransferase involved in cell wall biosynthesis